MAVSCPTIRRTVREDEHALGCKFRKPVFLVCFQFSTQFSSIDTSRNGAKIRISLYPAFWLCCCLLTVCKVTFTAWLKVMSSMNSWKRDKWTHPPLQAPCKTVVLLIPYFHHVNKERWQRRTAAKTPSTERKDATNIHKPTSLNLLMLTEWCMGCMDVVYKSVSTT